MKASEITAVHEHAAIKVSQPLGDFFAFSIKADLLNRLTYSLPAEVRQKLEGEKSEARGGYSIFGAQRAEKPTRLQEIASFIRTTDAAFPNAIILAANYAPDGLYIEDEELRWKADDLGDGFWRLRIPDGATPCASIIDGQHRLHAFDYVEPGAPERGMELLCVVYLELPTPYHAYLFATINFNQKKVDRSLAYELFGFDVDERPTAQWSPETLAVYLTRLLNTDKESPLYRCIFPAADAESLFSGNASDAVVRVSMATVVDGILRLITKNPQEDRNVIRRPNNQRLGRSSLSAVSTLPMRNLYLSGNDRGIYEVLCNYFRAVTSEVWMPAAPNSYLRKTVGVQALFDVLRELVAQRPISLAAFSVRELRPLLAPCATLDPDGEKYQASGIGRSEIRRDIRAAIGL
jgi:DNA phosphorothioation-associated DGQHR protein 1